MDTELSTSIVIAIGLPSAIGLLISFAYFQKDKVVKGIGKIKDNIADAIELHKEKDTIEYQEKLIGFIASGYSKEAAKAMLKASKKIEQKKRKQ